MRIGGRMKTGDFDLLRDMGRRISARRQELGLTQEKVAEQMDVSLQMVSNLELGKKAIRPENMVKLCKVLDVSADFILTGKRSDRENAELARKFGLLSSRHQTIIAQLIDSLIDTANG